MITQDRLKELLDYDPTTGRFTNRVSWHYRVVAGKRAGFPTENGYRKIWIDGIRYREHHLAWLYIYGEWPDELDHKDGNRSNNAINNLRLANSNQNQWNSGRNTGISGLRGVHLDKRRSKWVAQIRVGGQKLWLGTFSTREEARMAYLSAAEHHHGEFAFHNRNPQDYGVF